MDAPLNAEVHRLEEATWKPWGGKPAPHASTSIGIIGKWQNLLRRRALVPNAFTKAAELEVLNFIPHILEMRPSCVFANMTRRLLMAKALPPTRDKCLKGS